jgi:hypothetical protein
MTAPDTEQPGRPTLRIVRGDASPEEVAAILALLGARGGDESADEGKPAPVRGRWNDPARLVRRNWSAGPGGWRSAH